jgi:hypothetical protein
MKEQNWYVGARAELLAELILQEIFPHEIVKAQDPNFPYDFMLAVNTGEGIKTIGVEVKGTEAEVGEIFSYYQPIKSIERLQHANIPVLCLVANVKTNRVFYGWADQIKLGGTGPANSAFCMLPVVELTREEHEGIRERVLGRSTSDSDRNPG